MKMKIKIIMKNFSLSLMKKNIIEFEIEREFISGRFQNNFHKIAHLKIFSEYFVVDDEEKIYSRELFM